MSAVVLITLLQARIKQNLDDLKERAEDLEKLEEGATKDLQKDTKRRSVSIQQVDDRKVTYHNKDKIFLKSTKKYMKIFIWVREFNKFASFNFLTTSRPTMMRQEAKDHCCLKFYNLCDTKEETEDETELETCSQIREIWMCISELLEVFFFIIFTWFIGLVD